MQISKKSNCLYSQTTNQYIENPIVSKLLELVNKFIRAIQKTIIILYTSNEQLEQKFKTFLSTISKMKYLEPIQQNMSNICIIKIIKHC